MSPAPWEAGASVPNADEGMLHEWYSLQRERGCPRCPRPERAFGQQERRLLADSGPRRHRNQSCARFLAGPAFALRCQHYCFPGISCFSKYFCQDAMFCKPRSPSPFPRHTDGAIHLAAPSGAPAPQLAPWAGWDPGAQEAETGPSVSARAGDAEGLRSSHCPVRTAASWQPPPGRGHLQISQAAPPFGRTQGRTVSESIWT